MKLRTSPSSRRSSSRRNRSSWRASRASESKTRSMNSTWKIALERACAGPSWTSCASRARSASCASTIRIWSSVATDGSDGSITSEASPRSRNSHVLSRFLIASSRRDSSASCWASSPRDRSTSTRTRRRRSPAAPASAAVGGQPVRGPVPGRAAVRRHRPASPCSSDPEVVRQPLPAAEIVEVRLPVAVARRPQRVGRVGERLRGLRVQLVEPGRRPVRCGDHPSGRVYPRRGLRRGPRRTGSRRKRSAVRSQPIRNTRIPAMAAASAGSSGTGSATSRKQAAAGAGPSRIAGQAPCPGLPTMSQFAPNRGSDARSRTSDGVSSGSARVGMRAVSASQIGKSWITGAEPSSGAPMARHLPRQHGVGALRVPGAGREAGQQGDREQRRREHRQQRTQPRHRPRPAEAAAEAGQPGVQRAERRDDQQHVDRGRGVEERAPGRGHREHEARHQERGTRDQHQRPQRPVAGLPGERQQAEHGERDPQQEQDVADVVAEARRPASASRPAGPTAR